MASNSDSSWETLPSYSDFILGVYNFCTVYTQEHRKEIGILRNIENVAKNHQINTSEVLLVIILAAAWTTMRHYASKLLFKPMASHFGLTRSNQDKMPESAWKFSYYFLSWLGILYVVWTNGFFQRPTSVWDGWSLDSSVPVGVSAIYLLQSSFYLHALYATAFQDTWRKDSMLLQAHHLLTLGLLGFSHAFRYNNIGILILLFHDVSDIQLEFTKLNVYFKIQKKKIVHLHEQISNVGFICFMVTWFVSRLYWFPLKALHAAAVTTLERYNPDQLPFLFYINCLLWFLLAMDIYWFLLILGFLFRVATGQIKELDDTREYDVEEKIQRHLKESKNGMEVNKSEKPFNRKGHTNGITQHENLVSRANAKQRGTGDG